MVHSYNSNFTLADREKIKDREKLTTGGEKKLGLFRFTNKII